MRAVTECNLCGARDFEFLFKNHDRMYGAPGEFSVYKCSCGLILVNPQPDEEEIISFYPAEYGAYGIEGDNSIVGKFKKTLEQVFYNSNNDKALKRILLYLFRPLIRGALIKPGARLLDLGCGSGDFLEKMRTYGMDVYGIDFSDIAVSRAKNRGLNVFYGSLEEARFPEEYFDVITLNHVFEHLPDPSRTLQALHKILKKDGTIIMGVPNINSLGFKIFGKYWMPLETPRHLFLYSSNTLAQYAKKANLRIVKRSFQSFPCFTLLSFHYWINRSCKSELLQTNDRRSGSIFIRLCLFPFTTLLSWTPWADSVEVWLKKSESVSQ